MKNNQLIEEKNRKTIITNSFGPQPSSIIEPCKIGTFAIRIYQIHIICLYSFGSSLF